MNLAVPDAYKSNVMVAVGQGRNYPVKLDPHAILNALRIRYDKPKPNKDRANEAAFSTPWTIALPIEDYFFRLEECYITVPVALPVYTMDQMVYKASIAIQSTGLLSQAFLKWNVLLLKNDMWSGPKCPSRHMKPTLPRERAHRLSMDTQTI